MKTLAVILFLTLTASPALADPHVSSSSLEDVARATNYTHLGVALNEIDARAAKMALIDHVPDPLDCWGKMVGATTRIHREAEIVRDLYALRSDTKSGEDKDVVTIFISKYIKSLGLERQNASTEILRCRPDSTWRPLISLLDDQFAEIDSFLLNP